MNNPKIVMFGLGYIGLPSAALIAARGYSVHGVDINPLVVNSIRQGKIHIVEPDLAGLVAKVVSDGKLMADTRPVEADVFLVAVPTPFRDDHEPDLSYVESATDLAIPLLRPGNLFIIESTSPVGTTELMALRIYNQRPELKGKIYVAYCPERVLPGNVLHELVHNDRSIGGIDTISTEKAMEFYSLFVQATLFPTNCRTAEMCKLVENSSRDVNIAFANELSILCHQFDVNVWDLIRLANRHPRVSILSPGCGVGGHCIAVDPWFLASAGGDAAKIIRTARERNDYKSQWVTDQIKGAAEQLAGRLNRKPVIACMGLAFKPDIDDLRESPAMKITEALISHGLAPLVVEPNLKERQGMALLSPEQAVAAADLVVFLVGHKEFKDLSIPAGRMILDYCGVRNRS